MSQIDYANRAAQRPGLGPLTSSEKERETATKNRAWATVPLSIALTVSLFFLLQYWLPETSQLPEQPMVDDPARSARIAVADQPGRAAGAGPVRVRVWPQR